MNLRHIHKILGITFCSLLVTDISNVLAQSTLEEVTVTAQRRKESLQDVPISVTAFSGVALEKSNVNEAKDYFQFTPNVSFTEDGQAGQRSVGISIRGISPVAIGEQTVSNTFGIYLDEFNVAATPTGSVNPQLHDIEVIEVLRGPQGTYFGRNALGGALNITTKKPTADPFAELTFRVGRFDTIGGTAIVNAPITDTLFARGVITYESSDGMITNINKSSAVGAAAVAPNAARIEPNGDEYQHTDFRGSLRWVPEDEWTIDLSYSFTKEDDGGDSNVNSGVWDIDTYSSALFVFNNDPTFTNPNPVPLTQADLLEDGGVGFYPVNQSKINKNSIEFNRGDSDVINLRLNYEGENFSFRSVTGYLDTEHRRRFDQDVVQQDRLFRENTNTAESFSQEVRLSGTAGSIDWLIGGLYAKDEITRYSNIPVGLDGYGAFFPTPGVSIFQRFDTFELTSYAVFADATWHATGKIDAIIGVRYTNDDIDNSVNDINNNITGEASGSSDDFAPRLVLTYGVSDDVSVYGTISKGYKAGGVQLNPGLPGQSIKKENLWNYELGLKSELFDNRLRLNAAVFYMDWKDMQAETITIVTNAMGSQIVNNTSNVDAKVKGFELEVVGAVSDSFIIGGGVGHLDAEFEEFQFGLQGIAWDLEGQRIPRSPEWTSSAFGEYTYPISDNTEGWIRLEWSHRSETNADLEGLASTLAPIVDTKGFQAANGVTYPRADFPFQIPSFDVVNLRVGIEHKNWSVNAYVENLLDEQYYTGTQENFGLGGIRLRPHPRLWGASFSYRYNFL